MSQFRKFDLAPNNNQSHNAPLRTTFAPLNQNLHQENQSYLGNQKINYMEPKIIQTNFNPEISQTPLINHPKEALSVTASMPFRSIEKVIPFAYQEKMQPKPEEAYTRYFNHESQVLVRISSETREEYDAILTLKIFIRPTGSHNEHNLYIEFTDENDPFFLYTMQCGENDFLNLKNEQNLTIDFFKFPNVFVNLIERCIQKDSLDINEFAANLLILVSNDAQFRIVQTNQYKQLSHLNLTLKAGNDDSIKKYLAIKLKEFKEENIIIKHKLESKEEILRTELSNNENFQKEINKIKEEKNSMIQAMKIEEQRKLTDQKESIFSENSRIIKELNDEKKMLSAKLEAQNSEYTEKVQNLLETNNQLNEEKHKLEAIVRENSMKIESSSHTLEMQQTELDKLRTNNKDQEKYKFELEKKLTEITLNFQSLQRSLEDKELLIAKTNGYLEQIKNNNEILEEQLGNMKANASKMEDKLQQSAQEINKGNSIIQKLQKDIKTEKQKLKNKNKEIQQFEITIEQLKKGQDEYYRDQTNLKHEISRKDDEQKILKSTVEDLKSKLEESQKVMESNSQMIQWLNKSLSEAQKVSTRTAPLPPPASTLRSNILSKPSYQIDQPKQFNEIGLNLKSNIGRSLLGSISNFVSPSPIPYSASKYTTNSNVIVSSPNKDPTKQIVNQHLSSKESKSNNIDSEIIKKSVKQQKLGNTEMLHEPEKNENLLTFNKSNLIKKEYVQLEEPDQNDEFEREGNEETILPVKYTQPDSDN